MKHIFVFLLLVITFSCTSGSDQFFAEKTYPDVRIAGAMKNVMWKGELQGVIRLDTLQDKEGLYGLGPLSYLKGELLINDGQVYVSRVLSDSAMSVEVTDQVSAPFFVYGRVQEWKELVLPEQVTSINELEQYLDEQTQDYKRPFVFKLSGKVDYADIHIQDLPEGAQVSSPQEAHQGQTNYELRDEWVEIVGFFSTQHQGIFTHHDSFLHMHLISQDKQKMGHLDGAGFGKEEVRLYLPVR